MHVNDALKNYMQQQPWIQLQPEIPSESDSENWTSGLHQSNKGPTSIFDNWDTDSDNV